MKATLYTIAGTPNGRIAELLLEHKGVRYRRVELPQALHKPIVRMLGFGGNTVPALALAGRKVLGTRTISRALEAECPDPPLFPREPKLLGGHVDTAVHRQVRAKSRAGDAAQGQCLAGRDAI